MNAIDRVFAVLCVALAIVFTSALLDAMDARQWPAAGFCFVLVVHLLGNAWYRWRRR